jgi:hypothetical protein
MKLTSILAAVLCAACASDDARKTGTWQADRDTVGDTVVIRTTSGSVWSDSVAVVEELSIGELEGDPNYMFSHIQALATDARGGIYVFDGALRYYDANGRYVRTLGRGGAGPGEHGDAAMGLGVRRDQQVVLWDIRNARLNVYDSAGASVAHWPVASGLYTGNAFQIDTADHMYLKILVGRPEPNKPWPIGYMHLDANGAVVDTIHAPEIAGVPAGGTGTFLPAVTWTMGPLGDVVVGNSTTYMFEVRRRDGRVVRVEKAFEPVPVLPEEKAEHEAQNDWFRKTQGQYMTSSIPPVPNVKAAYKDLVTARDGRIWVTPYMRAVKRDFPAEAGGPNRPPPMTWVEPSEFDVFETDGTYLGRLRMPNVEPNVMADDVVWGVRYGDLDEQYVVRLRIRPASSSAL